MIDMYTRYVRTIFLVLLILFAAGIVLSAAGCGVAKDTKLQVSIKEELKKHKDVQAGKLTVNVQRGVVSISGELYTREEIDRVVQIVSAMQGVVSVKNLMSLPDEYNSRNPTFLDPFN